MELLVYVANPTRRGNAVLKQNRIFRTFKSCGSVKSNFFMMTFVSGRGGEGTAWLSCFYRSIFIGKGAMCVCNTFHSCEIFGGRKAADDVSVAVALGANATQFEARHVCNSFSASAGCQNSILTEINAGTKDCKRQLLNKTGKK